jgi:exodeoxyribonuclease VII small subunit
MKEDLSYSKAFSELTKLVEQIEDDEIQLDTLADKVKEANELIKYCETKLRTIEEDTTDLRK